jgi:hypothetical protein
MGETGNLITETKNLSGDMEENLWKDRDEVGELRTDCYCPR